MATSTELLKMMQAGACMNPEDAVQAPSICTNPTNAVVIDAQSISASACENISFTISNSGDARNLVWGTRGMAGLDPMYAGDPFQGTVFADSAAFSVNGLPNGAAFQGFNYRCANTGYLIRSIAVRQIPIASGLQNADLTLVNYGCDPDNLYKTKKVVALCSPCSSQNQTFTESLYQLGMRPVDQQHAIGLLIPAGTEEVPFVVKIDINIAAIATARGYVPCGTKNAAV